MFGFFKKKAPQWNDLSNKQRLQITSKIAKGVKALQYGARYKLVSSTDEWQRERGFTEFFNED